MAATVLATQLVEAGAKRIFRTALEDNGDWDPNRFSNAAVVNPSSSRRRHQLPPHPLAPPHQVPPSHVQQPGASHYHQQQQRPFIHQSPGMTTPFPSSQHAYTSYPSHHHQQHQSPPHQSHYQPHYYPSHPARFSSLSPDDAA